MLNRRETGLVPHTGWDIDRLFRDVFQEFPAWSAPQGNRFPAVNAWEDDQAYTVEAELPGFAHEDLEITVIGKELKVSGKREAAREESSRVYRRERFTGEFERVLRFPVDLDDAKVEARLDHGVLTVRLPKAAAVLPRKIQVQG